MSLVNIKVWRKLQWVLLIQVHDARLDDIAREFHVSRVARVRWSIRPLDLFEKAFEMGYEPDDFVDVVRAR